MKFIKKLLKKLSCEVKEKKGGKMKELKIFLREQITSFPRQLVVRSLIFFAASIVAYLICKALGAI